MERHMEKYIEEYTGEHMKEKHIRDIKKRHI